MIRGRNVTPKAPKATRSSSSKLQNMYNTPTVAFITISGWQTGKYNYIGIQHTSVKLKYSTVHTIIH